MSEAREMTLREWCEKLPSSHLVNRQLAAIAELIAADRELRAAEKALFQPGALANGVQAIERFKSAAARQEAALAAVGGEEK